MARWGVLYTGYADFIEFTEDLNPQTDGLWYANIFLYGNGVNWAVDSVLGTDPDYDLGVSLTEAVGAALAHEVAPIFTVGYAPSIYHTDDATPGGAPDPSKLATFVDDVESILDAYPSVADVVVWAEMEGMYCGQDSGSECEGATPVGWDINRYMALYNEVKQAADEGLALRKLWGPNVHLAARGMGYDEEYNGVLIDSRDVELLQQFIEQAEPDCLAFSGDFSPEDWPAVIEFVRGMSEEVIQLMITRLDSDDLPAAAAAVNDALGGGDLVFWPADQPGYEPLVNEQAQNPDAWTFRATLKTPSDGITAARFRTQIYSAELGEAAQVFVSGPGFNETFTLPDLSSEVLLGDLEPGEYSIEIAGVAVETGSAMLRFAIRGDNVSSVSVSGIKQIHAVGDTGATSRSLADLMALNRQS